MTINIDTGFIVALLSVLAGVLILLVPRLLNYIVAVYLIVVGVSGLLVYF